MLTRRPPRGHTFERGGIGNFLAAVVEDLAPDENSQEREVERDLDPELPERMGELSHE